MKPRSFRSRVYSTLAASDRIMLAGTSGIDRNGQDADSSSRRECFRDKFARNRMRTARTKRKCFRFISMPCKLKDELTSRVATRRVSTESQIIACRSINDRLQLALTLLKADYLVNIRAVHNELLDPTSIVSNDRSLMTKATRAGIYLEIQRMK